MKKGSILLVLVRRWFACQQGAIIVITAFMLLPLLIVLGVSIDGGLGMVGQRKLQAAVDAAIQAGKLVDIKKPDLVASEVQKIFAVNTGKLKNINGPVVTLNGKNLTVKATIAVPTTFMQLGGVKSVTYTATSTTILRMPVEIAVAVDASLASSTTGFLSTVSNQLIPFLTLLPPLALVSITPFATEILLDPITTNASALMRQLSPSANDESATPAFYAISNNYTWNSQSYGTVYNYLYGNAFPLKTSYYPLSGTCPGGYASCATLYPGRCSGKGKDSNPSCSSLYTYKVSNRVAILPLTANSTLLTTYLQNLASFTGGSHGLWGSLVTWAWRTIAPEWSDVFKTNSDPNATERTLGIYPKAYGEVSKNLILIVQGNSYWDEALTIGAYFTKKCGAATQVLPQTWKMTAYGVFPLTTNYAPQVNDISCDNYDYKLIDSSLGLNLSGSSFLATTTATTYGTAVLTSIRAKTARICAAIKEKKVNVFIITTQRRDSSDFTVCASKATYFYQTDGSAKQITNALAAIAQEIKALALSS